MTEKKKLKRAIRARAEAEGVSYQEMRRRMGVSASAPDERRVAIAQAAANCLRRAQEPPADVDRVAARIAERVCAACAPWISGPATTMDQLFERGSSLAAAVCDVLQPQLTPEQIQSIRAPILRDGVVIVPARGPVPPPTEEQLRREISDDEFAEVAVAILVASGPLVMEKPYCGYEQLFGGAVHNHIWPPDDADFEYLSDSDD